MKKKEKIKKVKYKHVDFPSVWGRVWRLVVYNAVATAATFWLFWGNFTLDDVAYELDYLPCGGLRRFARRFFSSA